MSMLTTFAAIKESITRKPSLVTYADARPRHAALAAFETPSAAQRALHGSSLSAHERNAVVCALLLENKRRPDPVWQALLLAAFEPMLVRIRRRMGAPKSEDLDQDLLVAFLTAIANIAIGPYTLNAIQWATEAPILAARRRKRHAPEMLEYDEDTQKCRPFGAPADERVHAVEVARIIESRGGAELLRAMIATHGTDESLKEHVAQSYAHLSEKERATTYRRLKEARQDVLDRLHAQLQRAGARAA